MKKMIMSTLVVCLCISVFAQKKVKTKIASQKELDIKMAYKGNTNVIGFNLGIGKMFAQKKITLNYKDNKSCYRTKQHFAYLNSFISNHPSFDNNLLLSLEYAKRTNFNDKLFIEGSVAFGVGKGLYRGPKTFVKQADGSLTTKKPDNRYIALTLMYGGGYNLEKKIKLPIKAYAKGGLNAIYYHKFGYFSIIGEVGIITNLSILKKRK
jgi:hypothetical protein